MLEFDGAARLDEIDAFRRDVMIGLDRPRKSLPSRWLYDDRGSALFEDITRLAEYYPARTETAILTGHAGEIAGFCGARAVLLEYGAGAGIKTEILVDALDAPAWYVPIDIAQSFVAETASRFGRRFPAITTRPIAADFSRPFDLPGWVPAQRRVGFFPGSTIGNLDTGESAAFLAQMRRHVGPDGRAVIGIDLKKDVNTLIAAYDDALGVTAEFDLNILRRINRELDGDFDLDLFRHSARWNPDEAAVEMHIVSLARQIVTVSGERFAFEAGETIHTESSRKYDVEDFARLAGAAGWRMERVWTDERRLFAVVGLA